MRIDHEHLRTKVLCGLLSLSLLTSAATAKGPVLAFADFSALLSPNVPAPRFPNMTGSTNGYRLPTNAIYFHLSWSPSPGTNIAGYKLYWGNGSRSYTNSMMTGTNLHGFITNLVCGARYWIAATASDKNGLESDYSVEVSAVAGLKEYVFQWQMATNLAGAWSSLLSITNQYWMTNSPRMDPMTAFYRINLQRTQ